MLRAVTVLTIVGQQLHLVTLKRILVRKVCRQDPEPSVQALRALPTVGTLPHLPDVGAAYAAGYQVRLAVLIEHANDLRLRLPDKRVGDLEGAPKHAGGEYGHL